jgi:hypothetical protein
MRILVFFMLLYYARWASVGGTSSVVWTKWFDSLYTAGC